MLRPIASEINGPTYKINQLTDRIRHRSVCCL